MSGRVGLHPVHEAVAAVDAGPARLVVHDQRDLALVADQLGHVLGRLGRGGLVVGRRRGDRDVAVHARVEGDDRDVLRLRLLHQRRARPWSRAPRSRSRAGSSGWRWCSIVDLLLDVAARSAGPSKVIFTLKSLRLLLGALLDRLPELVLEALGDDRDVRLLAAAAAAAARGRAAGHAVVGAARRRRPAAERLHQRLAQCCQLALYAITDLSLLQTPCGAFRRVGVRCYVRFARHVGVDGDEDHQPRITFCHSCGIDMICSPLLRTEMISAPMTVPTIEPLPPRATCRR